MKTFNTLGMFLEKFNLSVAIG